MDDLPNAHLLKVPTKRDWIAHLIKKEARNMERSIKIYSSGADENIVSELRAKGYLVVVERGVVTISW